MQPNISSNQYTPPGMATPSGFEAAEQAAHIQTPAGVILGENDSIAVFDAIFTAMQFFTPKTYEKDAQTPGLPPPADNAPDISPYGAPQQKIVKEFFANQVAEFIGAHTDLSPEDAKAIYEAIMTDVPLANPDLAKLAGQISQAATLKTIENCSLPKTWTLQSQSPSDWTPVPPKPYGEEKQQEINEAYDDALMGKIEQYIQDNNLDPETAAQLRVAAETGKVTPAIAEAFIAISDEARAEIQVSFGLPVTWYRGTESIDGWTPINLSAVNPSAVGKGTLDYLLANLEEMAFDVEAAVTHLLAALPDDGSGGGNIEQARVALTEFLKIIGDAIKDLKQNLRELQLADARKSEENTKAKFSQLADKRLRMNEDSEKLEKQLEKQLQMKSMGISMQIIGPLISAFMTLLGTLIAIASLGTAAPASVALIAAGAIIGTIMTMYSIADSVHGITQKAMEALTKAIAKAMPGASDAVKALVKALIMVAVIAVLLVMMVASAGAGSSAVANVGTSLATQVPMEVVKMTVSETVKQLTMQAIVIALMGSNVVPELVGGILKAAGVDKETVQIIELIVMAVTMFVCIYAMMKAMDMGVASIENAATSADDAVAQGVKGATTGAAAAADDAAAAGANAAKAGLFEKMETSLDEMVASASQSMKEFVQNIQDLPENTRKAIDEVLAAYTEGMPKTMNEFIESYTKLPETMKSMNKYEHAFMATNLIPLLPTIVGGAITGNMNLKVSNLLKDTGEIKSAIELLQGLIKMLEGLLKKIQSGMSGRDDFIAELQNLYKNLYDGATKSYGKLDRASLPA